MKVNYNYLTIIFLFFSILGFSQTNQIQLYNKIVFYNGYGTLDTSPTPAGITRLANSRYIKKLESTDFAQMLNTLSMKVTIYPLCDNYDRIGSVLLTIVPTGTIVDKNLTNKSIEIGRFITPFMDMNKTPNEVTYQYDLNHLMGMFKDPNFLQNNDIWVEFSLFGTPGAAQKEIQGCAGRNDVFEGSLVFETTGGTNTTPNFLPKRLCSKINMNSTNNSDYAGTAGRIVYFANTAVLKNANIQLITSAHGAGQGGEEYVRRDHFVSFDQQQVLTYKPGGKSCEPYRIYNTQANGIYGSSAKSATWWEGWNNWCPGDKIPNILINLGDIQPGNHSFAITVPSGQFVSSNDKIIVSAFLYSEDNEVLTNDDFEVVSYNIYPNPATNIITIESSKAVKQLTVFNTNGKKVLQAYTNNLNVSTLPNQVYLLEILLENGQKIVEKIIKQ